LSINCPVCQNNFGGSYRKHKSTLDGSEYECDQCGFFFISGTLENTRAFKEMKLTERAVLSHKIRLAQSNSEPPKINTSIFNNILQNTKLPTPAEQLRNAIEIIGDYQSKSGSYIPEFTPAQYAQIGALEIGRLYALFREAEALGLLTFKQSGGMGRFDLTLKGWEEYEQNKGGFRPGRYGFLAMKFGDPELDSLCNEVIKPGIKDALNYDVVDLRDVSRAGIIDNLMREQIRESAFVLVDLTHDNSGAYWEAGYAEGLGKPVIYLCKQAKFDDFKTHFDTNHLTTVMWSNAEDTAFLEQLVATLKRSLGLFQ